MFSTVYQYTSTVDCGKVPKKPSLSAVIPYLTLSSEHVTLKNKVLLRARLDCLTKPCDISYIHNIIWMTKAKSQSHSH